MVNSEPLLYDHRMFVISYDGVKKKRYPSIFYFEMEMDFSFFFFFF